MNEIVDRDYTDIPALQRKQRDKKVTPANLATPKAQSGLYPVPFLEYYGQVRPDPDAGLQREEVTNGELQSETGSF